jgi:hypothetical protein
VFPTTLDGTFLPVTLPLTCHDKTAVYLSLTRWSLPFTLPPSIFDTKPARTAIAPDPYGPVKWMSYLNGTPQACII